MRTRTLTLTAALMALASAWPAAAQAPATSSGAGRDSSAPLDIAADEMEVHQKECVSIWRGAAEALQDGARLRADTMTAHLEKQAGGGGAVGGGSSCGNITSIEAKGSVFYVSAQGDRARGDAAFYDASKDSVTMTGDVIAVQGQNVLRGSRMVFNTKTGEGQMQGQSTGRNKSGRVRGVFHPDKSSDSAKKK
jgi:lipopolysaccharide export system protein LptA